MITFPPHSKKGSSAPEAQPCPMQDHAADLRSVPAPVAPHPQVSTATPLAPWTGQLTQSARERTSSDGAGKGPKLRRGGEPMKAEGAGPGMPCRLLGLPQKPCVSMGKDPLSLSFRPFLEGLPRRLQSRTDTRLL